LDLDISQIETFHRCRFRTGGAPVKGAGSRYSNWQPGQFRFFRKIANGEACLAHHDAAPEYQATDTHGAGKQPKDREEIESEAQAGSGKRRPDEQNQGTRSERTN
jgi:hypothetical protein